MPTGSKPTDHTSYSNVRIMCQTAKYQTCCPTVLHCKVNHLELIKEHFPPPMLTAVLWMKIFLRIVSQSYLFSLLCFEERCVLCDWEEWGRGRKETDNFKCKPQIIYRSRGVTDNVHVSKISGTLETESPRGRACWWSVVFLPCLHADFVICFCH